MRRKHISRSIFAAERIRDIGSDSDADIIQRMNELSVQAANGTLSRNDREIVQKEIDQLKDEITRKPMFIICLLLFMMFLQGKN